MKKINKGFTLIELLVVIAIIGILASVILTSLGTARNKGVEGAFKTEVDSFKKGAELFYSGNNNAYTDLLKNDILIANGYPVDIPAAVATSTSGASVQNILWAIEQKAADGFIYGSVTVGGDAYALYARLPGITDPASVLAADIWCVDSTGKSGNPTTDAVDPLVDAPNSQFDGLPATVCW